MNGLYGETARAFLLVPDSAHHYASEQHHTAAAMAYDLEVAADYILNSGIPEIDDYVGYPQVQQQAAYDIAREIAEPNVETTVALEQWIGKQVLEYQFVLALRQLS